MEVEKGRLSAIRTAAEAIVVKLGGPTNETPNNNSRLAAPSAGIGILGQLQQLEKRWEDFVERIATVKMEVRAVGISVRLLADVLWCKPALDS